MTSPISPAMLRAFADMKAGPLARQHFGFLGSSGQRHHVQVVEALVARRLARIETRPVPTKCAVLTPLGRKLRPEG